MDGPVVLCGLGRIGWGILDCLRSTGATVVIIDTVANPDDPRLAGSRLVRGDCRDVRILETAGIRSAKGVIVATSSDLVNLSCALMVRRLAPEVRVVLRMFNQNLVARLGKAVPNLTALSVSALSAPLLALTATTGDVLSAFTIGQKRWQAAEVILPGNSIRIGQPVGSLDKSQQLHLLAHQALDQAQRLLQEIDFQRPLAPGDRIVAIGETKSVRQLIEPGHDASQRVLWAGKVRRSWRVARRTLGEMDLAVKIGAITMLVAVVASMGVYRFGLGHAWADGLYRTISVIATGSEMGGTEYEGWGKVFVSVLRIVGTVLVAAFTALLTNYLIRARLGGVLEVRRIPDSGHVVVIGLGNVGLRVVEELVRMEEQVVVVELRKDDPFAAICRRLRVPVIVGDATITEILRQARVSQARAVIAATSSDLVNLDVALLVAELNEKQRVVVRLGDSALAETARTAAGVRMAIALPELAAPAFVAALLGDRVLAMFLVGSQMLTAVEIVVHEKDARLAGHSLYSLAVDYSFEPLALADSDGQDRPCEPGYRLTQGDRLVIVTLVADLERIIRRAPVPANWIVEVTSFPLSIRETLVVRARALRGLNASDAEDLIANAEFRITERQTRGQALELLASLRREKVEGRIVQAIDRPTEMLDAHQPSAPSGGGARSTDEAG